MEPVPLLVRYAVPLEMVQPSAVKSRVRVQPSASAWLTLPSVTVTSLLLILLPKVEDIA